MLPYKAKRGVKGSLKNKGRESFMNFFIPAGLLCAAEFSVVQAVPQIMEKNLGQIQRRNSLCDY